MTTDTLSQHAVQNSLNHTQRVGYCNGANRAEIMGVDFP